MQQPHHCLERRACGRGLRRELWLGSVPVETLPLFGLIWRPARDESGTL